MYFPLFAFGTIIGSFLNVVLLRKNTGDLPWKGRSRCFSCGKKLSWFELIPILSFIIQRGRCRQCGSRIFWQYPIVEFITALLAIVVYTKFSSFGFTLYALRFTLFYFFAFCALFLVALYDFKHKIIDKHFLYIFGGFASVNSLFRYIDISTFRNDILSSLSIFLFFYLLWRLSGGKWMGRGDADLAFFLAIFLGYPYNLFMLLGSFWIGASIGIILLIVSSGRVTIKSEVPFGPFLAISSFIAWYFGDVLKFIYDLLYF